MTVFQNPFNDLSKYADEDSYEFFHLASNSNAIMKQNIKESIYLRFINILYIFKIPIKEYFDLCAEIGFETGQDKKSYFLYKLSRSTKISNGLTDYIKYLKKYINNNWGSYRLTIPDYLLDFITTFLEDTSNKILFSYDDFLLFIQSLIEKKTSLKKPSTEDEFLEIIAKEFFLEAIIILKVGIIYFDLYDRKCEDIHPSLTLKEQLTNDLLNKVAEKPDLAFFIRNNWDVFFTIYNNKQLREYFTDIMFCFFDSQREKIFGLTRKKLKQISSEKVLVNSIKYHCLLNFQQKINFTYKTDSLKTFFEKKLREDDALNYSLPFFIVFSPDKVTHMIIEELYFYACTLE